MRSSFSRTVFTNQPKRCFKTPLIIERNYWTKQQQQTPKQFSPLVFPQRQQNNYSFLNSTKDCVLSSSFSSQAKYNHHFQFTPGNQNVTKALITNRDFNNYQSISNSPLFSLISSNYMYTPNLITQRNYSTDNSPQHSKKNKDNELKNSGIPDDIDPDLLEVINQYNFSSQEEKEKFIRSVSKDLSWMASSGGFFHTLKQLLWGGLTLAGAYIQFKWLVKVQLPKHLNNMTSQASSKDAEDYALALAIEALNKNKLVKEKYGFVLLPENTADLPVRLLTKPIDSEEDIKKFTPEGAEFDDEPLVKQAAEFKLKLVTFDEQFDAQQGLVEVGCYFLAFKVRDPEQPRKLCYELHSLYVVDPSGHSFPIILPSEDYHNMKSGGHQTTTSSDVLDVSDYTFKKK
eukprot:gb/GECH01015007.1/.p1 GENE.gb/GECH01015007.1/~~gb/GECH01015007.1/.p1  ORF type:complete len:401 (+),score=94.81 gb/GECH01015007.1/:1-1203(+)